MTLRKFLLIICAALVGRLFAVNITSTGAMHTGSLQYQANMNTGLAQEPITTYSSPTTYDAAQVNLWRQIRSHRSAGVSSVSSLYAPGMGTYGGNIISSLPSRSKGMPAFNSVGGGFASSGSNLMSGIHSNSISAADLVGMSASPSPTMRRLGGIGGLLDGLESEFWTWCATKGRSGTLADYQEWWIERGGTMPGDMPGGTYQDLLDRLGIPVGELPIALFLLLACGYARKKNNEK